MEQTVVLVFSPEVAELIAKISFAILFHGASLFVAAMLAILANR